MREDMEEESIRIKYRSTSKLTDFDDQTLKLIRATIDFAANAYAPYSNFKVSAVVMLENGQMLKGTNVENASYPVGICAERTVLSHAVSNYPQTKIDCMAIYVDKDLAAPVPPCGLCRQSLLEAENRQQKAIRLILISKKGTYLIFEKSSDLLPLSFSADFL